MPPINKPMNIETQEIQPLPADPEELMVRELFEISQKAIYEGNVNYDTYMQAQERVKRNICMSIDVIKTSTYLFWGIPFQVESIDPEKLNRRIECMEWVGNNASSFDTDVSYLLNPSELNDFIAEAGKRFPNN